MESAVHPSQKAPSFRATPPKLTWPFKASTVCTLESKYCRTCINCFANHLFLAPSKHHRGTRVVLCYYTLERVPEVLGT